jgi:hypothetical protein
MDKLIFFGCFFGVIALIIGAICGLFWLMMYTEEKEQARIKAERTAQGEKWLAEENLKPKYNVHIKTKSKEEPIETKTFEPYYDLDNWRWRKFVTSKSRAESYINHSMENDRFRLGDEFIPTCEVELVKIMEVKNVEEVPQATV